MSEVGTEGGSAFHPDLRRVAPLLPRAAVGPRTYRMTRWFTGLASRRVPADVEVVSVGGISVRLHRPAAVTGRPAPALLWVHGGGYVIGTAAQDDAQCRELAEQAGVLVAAVDYRLAPEHPFPVPLDDCYAALAWLVARTDVDEHRVAIGGASAGGGLAAALAVLARDRGEIRPAFQLLTYPMLDDRTVLRAHPQEHRFRVWNSRANRFGWQAYLGTIAGATSVTGLAAPARVEDLTGVPPAWIGVGTLDLFHDEDLHYAARLRAAGVECEVEVVDGAFHGFDVVAAKSAVARRFRESRARALREQFFPESAPTASRPAVPRSGEPMTSGPDCVDDRNP